MNILLLDKNHILGRN